MTRYRVVSTSSSQKVSEACGPEEFHFFCLLVEDLSARELALRQYLNMSSTSHSTPRIVKVLHGCIRDSLCSWDLSISRAERKADGAHAGYKEGLLRLMSEVADPAFHFQSQGQDQPHYATFPEEMILFSADLLPTCVCSQACMSYVYSNS